MEAIKYQDRRQLVRNFLLLNPNSKDSEVINHFKKLGFPKTSTQRYIKRVKDGQDAKKKTGSGKPMIKLTEKTKDWLVEKFDGKTNISINQAARQLKVEWHVVKKWLDYLGIKKNKKKDP